MSEEIKDIDFKALFEKDFENEEICVSEDLIARTMAAIRGVDNEEEGKTENEIKNEETNIVSLEKRRKKTIIKMVSGFAAALVVGIVGLIMFRQGGMLNKKESAADSMKTKSDSLVQDNMDYSGYLETTMSPAVNYASGTQEESGNSDEEDCSANEEAAVDNSTEDNMKAGEYQSITIPSEQMKGIAKYEESIGAVTEGEDEASDDGFVFERGEAAEAPMDALESIQNNNVKDSMENDIIEEIVQEYLSERGEEGRTEKEHDNALIRSCKSYKQVLEMGFGIESESILSDALSEGEEDGLKKYIAKLLMEDLSQIVLKSGK